MTDERKPSSEGNQREKEMAEYRKKPVVIEAFQMTEECRRCNVVWPEWLGKAWNGSVGDDGSFWSEGTIVSGNLYLGTLEGSLCVSTDDWIIRGVKGELYPCKPDVFEMTYEEMETAGIEKDA